LSPVEVTTLKIQRAQDITAAFDGFRNRADALYVAAEPLVNENRRAAAWLQSRIGDRTWHVSMMPSGGSDEEPEVDTVGS
jgi:hypothetical protein